MAFNIGPYKLKNPFILAPMAGVSEMPFRVIAMQMGAALAPTELISAKGIFFKNRRTLQYLTFDKEIEKHYSSFYYNVKSIAVAVSQRIANDPSETMQKEQRDFLYEDHEGHGYRKIFFTGIETWKQHKILGNGIKSFRQDCRKIIIEQERGVCSNHPHNYFLEILTDLGIVGFIFVIAIALMFIVFLVKNYRLLNGSNVESLFLLAATISLFLEAFPIKSTGSIFTTNNTTYIILMSAIILGHKKILEGKNFG